MNNLFDLGFGLFGYLAWTVTLSSMLLNRAIGRSENLGVPVLLGEHNLSTLVEMGLTDLLRF